jgi:hypothetical protein
MNIHYKIVEVWPQDHLIVARFWTDVLSEEFLASGPDRKEDGTPVRCRSDVSITLPIPAPKGKELDTMILCQAPVDWLKTLESVQSPEVNTDLTYLSDMVGVTKSKNLKEIEQIINPTSQTQQLTDEDITALIEKLKQN